MNIKLFQKSAPILVIVIKFSMKVFFLVETSVTLTFQ